MNKPIEVGCMAIITGGLPENLGKTCTVTAIYPPEMLPDDPRGPFCKIKRPDGLVVTRGNTQAWANAPIRCLRRIDGHEPDGMDVSRETGDVKQNT